METIAFQEIKLQGVKAVSCAGGCGRRLRRQMTAMQTLNPFNKLPDGRVKTKADILQELRVEIDTWKQEPETCKHCREQALRDVMQRNRDRVANEN